MTDVKASGAHFGYRINYEEIWMKKFTKFKATLTKWKKRNLTLKGKRILINAFVIPVISFLTEIYTENIPDIFLKETKKLFCDFLWDGKTWKISQKTLALKKEDGGLEFSDIHTLNEAKKVHWILKIHFSEMQKWNIIGKHYLENLDLDFGQQDFFLLC